MPGVDKATGRVVALIVLLLAVSAALRGYLPAPHHGPRGEAAGSGAAAIIVVAILGAACTLVAIAVIARLRDPRAAAPQAGQLSEMLGTGRGRPSWRVVLIGLAIIVAWLSIVLVGSRLLSSHPVGQAPPAPASGAPSAEHANAPAPRRPHPPNGDMFGVVLAATVPMMLIIATGTIVMSRRRAGAATPGAVADDLVESAAPPTRSESLARAAERGLAEMTDLSREPREAIIACYAAMERELANVPGAAPQDFDTPTEVLARAVEHRALHADNAVQLVSLFAEARFSPHVMNEGHRDEAVRVLQLVLDELRSRSPA
ncbi:DUF4129 domain-containing protein [Mycobacterium scrofulaceum]|uniref:Protein-glutamine gamma-glutamyltransferase-like C-terminal domain-containing protein n=1 Tax=Mycobacterium scrofulaceum TaxID=1783 RepID=A0A1A2W8R7_MYCSC|nr:DUF4129 domain-containing protein [Mycobacterium scrofulaceum]OBI09964.1 hypothetical protein A5679_07555 [Mycobacterium scrofulaceum]